MLSILIPTYNYSCLSLVETLLKQCENLNISFEILVSEDAGKEHIKSNRQINSLLNCRYIENKRNAGRAGNINRLLEVAGFNLRLVLDCDTKPVSDSYIKTYLEFAENKTKLACFGGVSYLDNQKQKHCLRYNYGIKREAKTALQRKENAYKYLLTSNILLKNCDVKFDDRIKTYGYDDLVFSNELKEKGIKAYHIENPVYHLNLEDNSTYFNKTETSLNTLIFLEKSNILSSGITRISALFHKLRKIKLSGILRLFFKLFGKSMKSNVIKKGGPLYLFDLYKLLYFSKHY